MEAVANYIGKDKISGTYLVNVKTANPTGKIGDAGVIKPFETKKDAKEFIHLVNDTKTDTFLKNKAQEINEKMTIPIRHQGDVFQFSGNVISSESKSEPCPPISKVRAAFSRLTDAQVKLINESGELPEGTKFVQTAFGFSIVHNYFGLTKGTRKVPEGYELKNTVFGFTKVVPKGTEGRFIKK